MNPHIILLFSCFRKGYDLSCTILPTYLLMGYPKIDIVYFLLHIVSFFTFMADLSKIHHPSYNRYSEYTIPKSTDKARSGKQMPPFQKKKNLMYYFSTRQCILELPEECFQNYLTTLILRHIFISRRRKKETSTCVSNNSLDDSNMPSPLPWLFFPSYHNLLISKAQIK